MMENDWKGQNTEEGKDELMAEDGPVALAGD